MAVGPNYSSQFPSSSTQVYFSWLVVLGQMLVTLHLTLSSKKAGICHISHYTTTTKARPAPLIFNFLDPFSDHIVWEEAQSDVLNVKLNVWFPYGFCILCPPISKEMATSTLRIVHHSDSLALLILICFGSITFIFWIFIWRQWL